MSRVSAVNAAALLLALALSVALAGVGARAPAPPAERESAPEGPRALVDATGVEVPLRAYARIASASTVADRILLELCDPSRVIAVTGATAAGRQGHRVRGLATIESLDRLEAILALEPDLVLAHNVADARRVERLRDAGLTVFDLGPLEGRASLSEDVTQIAALCGARERGARYARTLGRRLDALRATVPQASRLSAIYASVYADRFYGGARGTSYHDVIEAAGLRDAAGARVGWPQYTVEELLELDPEVIVTREGMRPQLCGHPVLGRLRACPARVIELEAELIDAPGPGMLEAAEAIHDAVYGGEVSSAP